MLLYYIPPLSAVVDSSVVSLVLPFYFQCFYPPRWLKDSFMITRVYINSIIWYHFSCIRLHPFNIEFSTCFILGKFYILFFKYSCVLSIGFLLQRHSYYVRFLLAVFLICYSPSCLFIGYFPQYFLWLPEIFHICY